PAEPLFGGQPWTELTPAALTAYEEARISGLCHEGAWEIALEKMRESPRNEAAHIGIRTREP
ncbi:MAG TPA: hypothetical protein VJB15_09620, partial [Rhodothermia bacterium]|nr:hypothetical protein [Rhodothermia bacterium]